MQPAGSTSYAAYLAGARDVSGVSAEAYASARSRPDFHQVATLAMFSLALNWSKPPFNDERIRRAFALALNKVQLVRDSIGDIGFATNHLVPQGMPGYFAGLMGPDNTTNLTGNVASASALAQAYANDACGGNLRRCPPVEVLLPAVNSAMSSFGAEAKNMWQQAMPGYPITIRLVSPDVYNQRAGAGMFQMIHFGWAADYPDPQDWLSLLLLPNSPWNIGHINLEEANLLMRQADVDQNATRRLSEYNQAEQRLVTAVAKIPIYQFNAFYVARSYVINYALTATLTPSPDTWQRVYIARH